MCCISVALYADAEEGNARGTSVDAQRRIATAGDGTSCVRDMLTKSLCLSRLSAVVTSEAAEDMVQYDSEPETSSTKRARVGTEGADDSAPPKTTA